MSGFRRKTRPLPFAALLFALLGVQPALAQPGPASSLPESDAIPAHRPDELIVRFRPVARAADRAAVRARVGARALREFDFIQAQLVRLEGVSVAEALERLRNDPLVEYAEPNYVVRALIEPNDESYFQQFALRNTGQTGGLPGADIRAAEAWDLFTGDPELKIGVIDTGVDYTHPDLAANIWTNPGEIPGNGRDDDRNGYVDDVHGYDFANGDGDPFDDDSHGTHVAGIIAAHGNNGVGITGINWRAKIVAIKFLGADGSGTIGGAIGAIQYAITVGVRLTNNSWGGGPFSQALIDAILAAGDADQLFVAAAGNDNRNNDQTPFYPASFNPPSIVSVAATDHNDQRSGFSNYGLATVDLAAPGSSILSTIPDGGYYRFSGTSMAAPHVTGALAFLLGRFPSMSGLEAKARLMATVKRLPNLASFSASGGRLDLFAAAREPESLPPGSIADLAAVNPGSNTMGLTWTAPGDDGQSGRAVRYEIQFTGGSSSHPPKPGPVPQPAGSAESTEVGGLDFGTTYQFKIRAFDENGNAGPFSNVAVGTTLGIPDVSVTPGSISQTLASGATATQSLIVRNDGEGTLDFTVPDLELTFAQSVFEDLALARGESDPRPGILGSGGPDGFGYRWRDNISTGGPPFSWVDIAVVGQPVPITGDEEISGPISMGMSFPFYGRSFSTVYVSSNGFITFTGGTGPSPVNQPLPGPGAPPELIAPFWDDLYLPGTNVYTHNDGSRFIVSWVNVQNAADHAAGIGPYTFQVILYPSGEIRFQYLSMSPAIDFATTGIQNGARTMGLTVAFNTYYVRGQLSTRIHREPPWLAVSPRSGRVHSGQEAQVLLSFDATGLAGGTYEPHVRVSSNDPDEPGVTIPIQLQVIGAPDVRIERPPRVIESAMPVPPTADRPTRHDLHVPEIPPEGGVFELLLEGLSHRTYLTVEGRSLGRLERDPCPGCLQAVCIRLSREFAVDAATLAEMAADRVVSAVALSCCVYGNPGCNERRVVRLRYPLPANVFDFGTVFEGLDARDSLWVRNQGTETLHVTSIDSSHPAFSVSPAAFAVPAGESRTVVFTYNPSTVDSHEGEITIRSDDADQPAIAVAVRGLGIARPVLAASPQQLASNLSIPATEVRTVTLANPGGSNLVFTIRKASDGAGVAYEPPPPPYVPADQTRYRWLDGGQAGGPTFAWVDIAQPVNKVYLSAGQDAISLPIPLGMSFPFYGSRFTEIRVTTNGFLTFSSCCPAPSNVRLPSTVATAGMIAPFWDALSSESIYARNDGSRFIVSWIGALHRLRPGGSYTFQAILHPNGIVVYQYRSMTGTLSEATVGIQNMARNDGLTVAHNTSYLHDGLAIMLAPPLQFMTLWPAAGIVPPGGAIELGLALHTFGLAPGVYRDSLEISSSVPGQPAVSVPVTLSAGLQADIAATPVELDFGTVRVGLSLGGTVEIRNSGMETLDLTGAEVTGDGFGLDSPGPTLPVGMGPGESIQLAVRFEPSDVCAPCAGVLALHSSDPDESPLLVPLLGTGAPRRPGPRLRRPGPGGDVDPVSSLAGSDLVRAPGQLPGRAGARPNETVGRKPGDYGLMLQGTSPQRASARFELAIPVRSQVELSIFDTQGRFVAQVARRAFDPGWHHLEWNGSERSGAPAPAGVYFARLVAGRRALHVRIALLR